MGYVLVKRPGRPPMLMGGGQTEDGAMWDVMHRVKPSDEIGGQAVREWPDGVTKIDDDVAQKFLRERT